MPRATRMPPLLTDGIFSVSGNSIINASREQVWKVLLDFDSYEKWNPFVRKQRVVDANKRPLADPTPAEGKFLAIGPVHIPPTMTYPGLFRTSSTFCEIIVVDHENYRVAWDTAPNNLLPPTWLLATERWQILTDLGDGRTQFDTFEVFSGPVAYLVKWLVGSGLKLGFQAHADTLKERSESEAAAAFADPSSS